VLDSEASNCQTEFQTSPARNEPESSIVNAKFNEGLAWHQWGKLLEAECLYEEFLLQDLSHSDALYLAGSHSKPAVRSGAPN
jgi:hypothetical protein